MTYAVVNHLHFTDPVEPETIERLQAGTEALREAGAHGTQVVQVDARHLIVVAFFPSAEVDEGMKRAVGGPLMREHLAARLSGPPERFTGEVVASA